MGIVAAADGRERSQDAGEIRRQAGQWLGELLREMPKNEGGRPKKPPSHNWKGFSTTEANRFPRVKLR